jgi:ATP-dependent Clp protease ATP-binding subunit ClpA
MAKAAIGFGNSKRTGDDEEAINRLFTPEFRNRLDATIAFDSLPPPVVHQVVQKFVLQLEAQLADRGVTFELDDKATAWLAEHGYDERMGARPLSRLIQEVIKKPLADEVLFGKLNKGGVVKVSVEVKEDGKTGIKLESIPDENATRKQPPLTASDAGGAPETEARKPRTRTKKPRGGSSVPIVPLKA